MHARSFTFVDNPTSDSGRPERKLVPAVESKQFIDGIFIGLVSHAEDYRGAAPCRQ
jgi:hypothetical protein